MYEPREPKPGNVGARLDGERRPAPGKSTRTARLRGGPLGGPAGADANGGADLNGGAYGMPTPIGGGMPELDDPFGLHLPTTGTTFVGDDGVPPTDMFADQRAALANELERLIARAEWPALRPEARGAAIRSPCKIARSFDHPDSRTDAALSRPDAPRSGQRP